MSAGVFHNPCLYRRPVGSKQLTRKSHKRRCEKQQDTRSLLSAKIAGHVLRAQV